MDETNTDITATRALDAALPCLEKAEQLNMYMYTEKAQLVVTRPVVS
jgi:hypothetical protein